MENNVQNGGKWVIMTVEKKKKKKKRGEVRKAEDLWKAKMSQFVSRPSF